MAQPYIKISYLDELKQDVSGGINLEMYLENVFPIPEESLQVIPQLNIPDDLASRMDADNDFSAALELYSAYRNLTPVQATDTYFWESLAHTNLYDYVKRRWNLTYENLTPDFILQHWFVSSSAAVSRHSLASLWWPVFLTKDDDAINPYELTEVLFRNQTFRTRTYGTSLVFRIKEANMGILRYILDHPDLTNNFEKAGLEIYKHFNRLGAVKQLSFLDRKFFYEEMGRAHKHILEAINKPDE